MAYGFYASITVDNTKVSGSGDHSNFPILVSGTYDGTGSEPDLRVTGSSGNIENVDTTATITGSDDAPADLVFSASTDGSSPYDHEIQYYDSTTGKIIAWVKIPTLDYNDDTVIYMVYGDSGVSTSQEDINNVWSSVFESVYHLQGDGSDSAGNWDMTGVNAPSYVAGKIGNCITLNGSTQNLENSTATALKANDSSALYVSAWLNTDDTGNYRIFLDSGYYGASGFCYEIAITNAGKIATNTRNNAWIAANTALSTGTWAHVSLSFDGSSNVDFTKDAATDGTPAEDAIVNSGTHNGATIGQNGNDQAYWDGEIDELRVAFTDLGTDWGITEHNTQNSPSTFYTMGDEISGGAAAAVPQRTLTGVGS